MAGRTANTGAPTHRSGLVALLFGTLALAGCRSGAPSEAPGEAVAIFDHGVSLLHLSYSGFSTPERLVVRDADTWARVWAAAFAPQSPAPPLPTVDFSRDMVVVAALGTRPHGAYDIGIDGLVAESGGPSVLVTTSVPGEDCSTTQALTRPIAAVRVGVVGGRVGFRDRTEVRSCD